MNARQIFHEHLLLGKILTIAFPDRKALLTFRSELQTAKRRLEESSARFGFETGTEGQSICTSLVEGTALTYTVWLGIKPTKPNPYTILNITDGTAPE